MNHEDFIKVMELQDEKNTRFANESVRQMLEAEFVLSNVVLRYLDFIEKSKYPQKLIDNVYELLNKGGPPTKKLLDFDISKHMKNQTMYLHRHTYIELDYVYKGYCTYYIDNERNSFRLGEKEMCIINQNVIHGIEENGNDNIIIKCMIPFEYIELDNYIEISNNFEIKKFLKHAVEENVTKPFYMLYRISDSEYFEEILYRMFFEYISKNIGWRRAIKNNLSNIFLYLIRAEDKELLTAKAVDEENFNIVKLIECINKNYQFITLKDLAKDFHFHENYLSRIIKQHSKKSFRELLCHIRLKEAERLLIDTELSVTEIAKQVGYLKPGFFFKLFKQHYNMTPIEFRSKHVHWDCKDL